MPRSTIEVCVLLLLQLCPALLLAASPADVFVDGARGTDARNAGTREHPWKTISYAVSQLDRPGVTVRVAEGSYGPGSDVQGGEQFPIRIPAGTSLVGAGPESTTIDAMYEGQILVVEGPGGASRVEGIAFANGVSSDDRRGGFAGACISIRDAQATVRQVVVRGCVSSTGASGIVVRGVSDVRIVDATFHDNVSSRQGVVSIQGAGTVAVERCRFMNNRVDDQEASAVIHTESLESITTIVRNNYLRDNLANGIVTMYPWATTVIANNTIVRTYGHAVVVADCGQARIRNNIIANNGGFGLALLPGCGSPGPPRIAVEHNVFYRNSPGGSPGSSAPRLPKEPSALSWVDVPTNLAEDPLLPGVELDDFHLLPNSPCVDAGTREDAPRVDLDGERRDAQIDIGADEIPSRGEAYVAGSRGASAWAYGAVGPGHGSPGSRDGNLDPFQARQPGRDLESLRVVGAEMEAAREHRPDRTSARDPAGDSSQAQRGTPGADSRHITAELSHDSPSGGDGNDEGVLGHLPADDTSPAVSVSEAELGTAGVAMKDTGESAVPAPGEGGESLGEGALGAMGSGSATGKSGPGDELAAARTPFPIEREVEARVAALRLAEDGDSIDDVTAEATTIHVEAASHRLYVGESTTVRAESEDGTDSAFVWASTNRRTARIVDLPGEDPRVHGRWEGVADIEATGLRSRDVGRIRIDVVRPELTVTVDADTLLVGEKSWVRVETSRGADKGFRWGTLPSGILALSQETGPSVEISGLKSGVATLFAVGSRSKAAAVVRVVVSDGEEDIVPLYPEEAGVVGKDSPPRFVWFCGIGQSFQLVISDSEDFSIAAKVARYASGRSEYRFGEHEWQALLTSLEGAVRLYWRVEGGTSGSTSRTQYLILRDYPAPYEFVVVPLSANEVQLFWRNPIDYERLLVYRRFGRAPRVFRGEYPGQLTTIPDSGLRPDTSYEYRLKAGFAGDWIESKEVRVRTDDDTCPPPRLEAPGNRELVDVSSDLVLSWDSGGSRAAHYWLEVYEPSRRALIWSEADGASYTIEKGENLAADSIYYWRVWATDIHYSTWIGSDTWSFRAGSFGEDRPPAEDEAGSRTEVRFSQEEG